MFNCRVCSNTPFGSFFGYNEDSENEKAKPRRSKREIGRELGSRLSQEDSNDGIPGFHRATSVERSRFRPRYADEIHTKVSAWFSYLHSRAHQFWNDDEMIRSALARIAGAVDRESDPILGELSNCVFWHGDVSEEDKSPVITIVKPGEQVPTEVSVTRILVFLYADDDSFDELQKKPKQLLKMICDEPNCVNLTHIALD